MKLRAKCKSCGQFSREFVSKEDEKSQVLCVNQHAIYLKFEDFLTTDGLWQSCPVCSSTDAFLCKVVPRKIMMVILVPTMVVAFFALAWNWWVGFAVLIASAVVDAMLFKLLPNMLVCYGCESEFRPIPKKLQAAFSYFDHHMAEKYRQRKQAIS